MFEPSFGDEVNRHSFHNGRVVVVFSEKLGELGFFVIEDLFRSEFGCLDCDESLHNGLDLFYTPQMILVKIIMIVLDPIFYFHDLINFKSRIQILSLELKEPGLKGNMNVLGIFNILDQCQDITIVLTDIECLSQKEVLFLSLG